MPLPCHSSLASTPPPSFLRPSSSSSSSPCLKPGVHPATEGPSPRPAARPSTHLRPSPCAPPPPQLQTQSGRGGSSSAWLQSPPGLSAPPARPARRTEAPPPAPDGFPPAPKAGRRMGRVSWSQARRGGAAHGARKVGGRKRGGGRAAGGRASASIRGAQTCRHPPCLAPRSRPCTRARAEPPDPTQCQLSPGRNDGALPASSARRPTFGSVLARLTLSAAAPGRVLRYSRKAFSADLSCPERSCEPASAARTRTRRSSSAACRGGGRADDASRGPQYSSQQLAGRCAAGASRHDDASRGSHPSAWLAGAAGEGRHAGMHAGLHPRQRWGGNVSTQAGDAAPACLASGFMPCSSASMAGRAVPSRQAQRACGKVP